MRDEDNNDLSVDILYRYLVPKGTVPGTWYALPG